MKSFTFTPIGVVRSPFKRPEDIPPPNFQPPGFLENARSELVLRDDLAPALEGIGPGSEIVVLFVFHASEPGYKLTVVPPGAEHSRGLFASRSPHRPNPIGMTTVKVLSVRGSVLEVSASDMIDGTPILDLKPAMHKDTDR